MGFFIKLGTLLLRGIIKGQTGTSAAHGTSIDVGGFEDGPALQPIVVAMAIEVAMPPNPW